MVVVCSNSGPLMALAKLDMLLQLFLIYPSLTISEIVYHEVVTAGLSIGAKDAEVVDKFCRSNQIIVFPSKEIKEFSLSMASELHSGELETIKMALQIPADYVFPDDFDARQVGEINIKEMSGTTIVRRYTRYINERNGRPLGNEHFVEMVGKRLGWILRP